MMVKACCPVCSGEGRTRSWFRHGSANDPDNYQITKPCRACEGNGVIDVMVDEPHPDLLHDAAVDAVEARGFFLTGDEQ